MKLYTFTRMPALALSTAPPRVTLLSAPQAPYDGAIAAARTCYSPRVITRDEVTDRQRDSIGPLTFEGGHHTVFQHAHFEFGLENISRQFVWSVLHAYPVLQLRAVEPALRQAATSRARSCRRSRARRSTSTNRPCCGRGTPTRELSALLKDDAWAILKELRYVRPTNTAARLKAVEREAEKKAIETARYVIPIARVHVDGAHRLGPGAAPPAPDDERRRHAVRSADGDWRDGRSRQGGRPDVLRQGRARDARAPTALPEAAIPAPAGRGRRVRARVRSPAGRPGVAAARLVGRRRARGGRRGARHLRADRRGDGRCRGDRSGDEPGAESLPHRHAQRRRITRR